MSADLDGLELRLGDAGLGTPRISAIAGPSPITKLAPLGSRPPGGSGRSASSNRLSRPAEHHLGDDALLLIGATRGPAQPRNFRTPRFAGRPPVVESRAKLKIAALARPGPLARSVYRRSRRRFGGLRRGCGCREEGAPQRPANSRAASLTLSRTRRGDDCCGRRRSGRKRRERKVSRESGSCDRE
jgi:hypothetical protein